MIIKLDTIKDGDFNRQGTGVQVSRGGVITGITDDDVASAADYFFVADTAIRADDRIVSSTNTWPGRADLFYQGTQIVGVSGRTLRFKALFGSFSAAVASVYTISDRSFQASYEGNLTPGTRKPILVGLDNADPKKKIPLRLATMRFNRTVRVLSVTKLLYGDGEADRQAGSSWVNTTNNNIFQGLPAYYWACAEYSVQVSRYQGYFTRTMSALCKTDEDVSEFEFLRSPITDKHAVDPSTPAKVAAILALTYKQGVINNSGTYDSTKCGIVRVGPYAPAPFATLFGWSSSDAIGLTP